VEFLYPSGLARWAHILLLKWSAQKNAVKLPSATRKKGGVIEKATALHSRTIEQRTEVVKDRVYVHPLPQLLDNIAYLIICLPPCTILRDGSNRSSGSHKCLKVAETSAPIWAILVDCSDGPSIMNQVRLIRDVHYEHFSKNPFNIHAILSTHKHHDHTAGNRFFWKKYGKTILSKKQKKRKNKNEGNPVEDSTNWTGMMGIVGGAVEKVPYGTIKVANGDRITLPGSGGNDNAESNENPNNNSYESYGNNMADLVEIECIAVPSHTRGSIVYALRNFPSSYRRNSRSSGLSDRFDDKNEESYDYYLNSNETEPQPGDDLIVAHLFSGDTMFSAGAGVPFEADIELPYDKAADGKGFYSTFKPSSGTLSTDRCFAEILIRGLVDSTSHSIAQGNKIMTENMKNRMLLFPGHEYTLDLMARQLDNSRVDAVQQWEKHNPSAFFELVSHYFVMNHRRGLPKCTRLLTVPTSISREMKINPHMRSLKRRGEHIMRAVSIWFKYGNRKSLIEARAQNSDMTLGCETQYLSMPTFSMSSELELRNDSTLSDRTKPTDNMWTTTHSEVNTSIFTTVYSKDMGNIVGGLRSGLISAPRAARKLEEMVRKMEDPTLLRRPIPGTIPNEKNMFLGTVALAVLGSPPSAMCKTDAEYMRLVAPVENSDYLLISKRRLVEALRRLDFLPPSVINLPGGGVKGGPREESKFVQMIDLLWIEARMDIADIKEKGARGKNKRDKKQDRELENRSELEDDLIELGSLKQTLYSIPYNQPSWFSKFCMPCKIPKERPPHIDPRTKKQLKRSGGELVRHDTLSCPMCWNVIGCPIHFQPLSDDEDEEIFSGNGRGSGVRTFKSKNCTQLNIEMTAFNR